MKQNKIIIIITLIILFATTVHAGDNAKKPYNITSDSLVATKESVVFTGNVKIKYNEMRVEADRAELLYDSEAKGDKVKTIIATGNVKYSENDRVAKARKMVYDRATEVVTLTGDPRIRQGDNIITCEEIKVFLKEDRYTATGKVNLLINPDGVKSGLPKD